MPEARRNRSSTVPTPTFDPSRVVIACAALLAIGIGAALVVSFWDFTVDDTFITLRYARNLAQGHGLVWNPGEAPAEGYTSLSWTLLLAFVHGFVDDAERAAKAGSSIATICGWVAGLGFAFDSLETKDRGARALGIALVALWPTLQLGTAVHAVSGMDTALFALVVTGLSWISLRLGRAPTRGNLILYALSGLVVGLTRPEGNVFFGALTLGLFFVVDARARADFVRSILVFYFVPATAFFAWRVNYYGELFPLPFYVKAVDTGAFWAGAEEGGAFFREIFLSVPALLVLVVVGIVRGARELRPVWWASAALFVFFLKPAPLMAYNHRYLHPLLPLCAVAAAQGVVVVFDAFRARTNRHVGLALASVLVLSALVATTTFGLGALPGNWSDKGSYARGLVRAHEALGRELAQMRETPGARRVALLDVGSVAYHARDWAVLDTFGLTDAVIARRGRDAADYVLSRDPSFVVFVSSEPEATRLVFPHERSLLEACRRAGYRRRNSLEFVPDYHLVVFEKGRPGGASPASKRTENAPAVEPSPG